MTGRVASELSVRFIIGFLRMGVQHAVALAAAVDRGARTACRDARVRLTLRSCRRCLRKLARLEILSQPLNRHACTTFLEWSMALMCIHPDTHARTHAYEHTHTHM